MHQADYHSNTKWMWANRCSYICEEWNREAWDLTKSRMKAPLTSPIRWVRLYNCETIAYPVKTTYNVEWLVHAVGMGFFWRCLMIILWSVRSRWFINFCSAIDSFTRALRRWCGIVKSMICRNVLARTSRLEGLGCLKQVVGFFELN